MAITIDEHVENTIAEHISNLADDKDIDGCIDCEISGCDGHYVGLYWQPYEYDEDISYLVMQCYKCRDEIEI